MIYMSENKSYNDKLYDTCNYMIDHIEEFKDCEIYEGVTCRKARNSRGEIVLYLHNRFLAQFKFLIGEGGNKPIQTDPKGTDIAPKIHYQLLDQKTLAVMLAITDNFIYHNDSGKKLNQQVYKIDIEKKAEIMDFLIEKIMPEKIVELEQFWEESVNKSSIPGQKEYFKLLEHIYDTEKNYFRPKLFKRKANLWDKYHEKVNFYREEFIEKIHTESTDIFFYSYPRYGKLEDFYNTRLYVYVCCDAILEYVKYGILMNDRNKNKIETIKKVNEKLIELIGNINVPIVKCSGSPEENLFNIYSFYFIRDGFLQYTKTIKQVTEDCGKRAEIAAEATLQNFYSEKKKRTWSEIQNLFEGGKKNDEKTFKKNLANCYLLLEKCNMAGVMIPKTPVALKAMYKGIYLNKTRNKDKRKTSMAIMNALLTEGDIEESMYYWMDELLNRYFFEENGLLEEYFVYNELRENFYCLISKIIAGLNLSNVVYEFDKVLYQINLVIDEVHNICGSYAFQEEYTSKCMWTVITPSKGSDITPEKYREIYKFLEAFFNISDSIINVLDIEV